MKEIITRPQTRYASQAPTCGICYNSIEQQGILDCCKHQFCATCIETWANIENTCPLCKSKFSTITKEWRRVQYQWKSKKITKRKQNCVNMCIHVEDKSQSEDQHSIWWELLIEFLFTDSY